MDEGQRRYDGLADRHCVRRRCSVWESCRSQARCRESGVDLYGGRGWDVADREPIGIDPTPPTLASGLLLFALSCGQLGLDSSPPTLDWGLIPASLTWDL